MIWWPIESAPKDRRILLYYRDAQSLSLPWFVVGGWDEESYFDSPKPHWTCDLKHIRGVRWHRANNPAFWAEIVEPSE